MKNIALITCYFGKFPWYFNLFLKSCAFNRTVDFVIFSDCQNSPALPENVKIIPFTINDFNLLATKKLGFEVAVKSAYKLCDFKPSYGVIFSEYLIGYDFWGMADIDIIFGRIREFMTNELLNDFDVISVRNDYPTGSFMLFKNNQVTNGLFRKSRDFQMVFQSDRHYCFDECNFKHNFLQEGGNIDDIDCEIESMHHVIMNEIKQSGLRVHFDFLIIEGLPGNLKWEKGLLTFKNKFEVLLYHLIQYKAHSFTVKRTWHLIPDIFFIDKFYIRRFPTSDFRGYVMNFFYNRFIPYFSKLLFKFDYSISNSLKFDINFEQPYIYKLNEVRVKVNKPNNEKSKIFYNDDEVGYDIIKSLFHSNSFYIKNYPIKRFFLLENKLFTRTIDGQVGYFDKEC